ncbi:MAG: GntR family transcriptional regulator [Gammaproteobacteria bacterium]
MQIPICLDFLSAETLQAQIVGQVCDLIRDGQLQLGSAVPSSRELSEQLHVSRNTVVEAYELLIEDGYPYTQRAVGTVVSKPFPTDSMRAGARNLTHCEPSRRRAVKSATAVHGTWSPRSIQAG